MEKKFCSNCGAELKVDARFCTNCGKSVSNGVEPAEDEPKTNKKSLYALLAVLGAIVLVISGAIYYSDSQERNEARLAREKFVKDSLEAVKQDSLKLAEMKEQEELEAQKLTEFRKKMSFENFLGMLNHYDKESYAKKCGLSLLYKDVTEEEFGESIEIVYGYDVEKGNKKDWSYEILSKSNHACFFRYNLDTSTHATLSFKDKEDANILFKKAKDYGLILHGDTYFIPNKKLPNGKVIILDEDEFDNSIYEKVCGMISTPDYQNGWYVIGIGIDF